MSAEMSSRFTYMQLRVTLQLCGQIFSSLFGHVIEISIIVILNAEHKCNKRVPY